MRFDSGTLSSHSIAFLNSRVAAFQAYSTGLELSIADF